jgi:hypothetical protein
MTEMLRQRPTLLRRILLALLAGVAICALLSWHLRRENAARQEIILFATMIEPGASQEAVKEQFTARGFKHLALREGDTNLWLVATPIVFGARNWHLYIEFRDSKVETLKMRIADSKDVKPKGSPPDRQRAE